LASPSTCPPSVAIRERYDAIEAPSCDERVASSRERESEGDWSERRCFVWRVSSEASRARIPSRMRAT